MTAIAIIDLRLLIATNIFASDEETRYYLRGVCLEVRNKRIFYTATDGHRLMTSIRETPRTDFQATIIVPSETIKLIKIPKKHTGDGELIQFDTGDYAIDTGIAKLGFKPVDGSFPDYRRVVPRELTKEQKQSHWDFDYARDFKTFADKMGLGMPTIFQNDGSSPMPVIYADPTSFGVLMPMRPMGLEFAVPAWLEGGAQ